MSIELPLQDVYSLVDDINLWRNSEPNKFIDTIDGTINSNVFRFRFKNSKDYTLNIILNRAKGSNYGIIGVGNFQQETFTNGSIYLYQNGKFIFIANTLGEEPEKKSFWNRIKECWKILRKG